MTAPPLMSVEEIKESLGLTDEEWEAIQTPDWELRLRGMAEKAMNPPVKQGSGHSRKKSRRKTAGNSKRKNRKK